MSGPLAPALLAATSLIAFAVQAQPPALPQLPIETFPAAAREAIEKDYRRSTARPDDAAAIGALGRTLQAWDLWEPAHQAYARAHALAPRVFEWPYLDAVVLQRLAKYQEVTARLREALAIDPAYLAARVRLAEALLEAGEPQESARRFAELSKEPAAEPAAKTGLGRIAAAEGRHEEAITQFERAVALFPELGAAHYGLARSYRALGRAADAERALQQYKRYGAAWPRIEDPILDTISALRNDARADLHRGIALVATGDLDGAISAHEAALRLDSSLVQAHANLVSLYGRKQNWPKAEAHYRSAVAAGLSHADLYYDYGLVQAMQQKWTEASDAYRRAIAINPLHVNARINLGQILERTRDFEAAAVEYREAVAAQPTMRLSRFNLGRMLLALGRADEAIVEFERVQQPVDAETPRYVFALSTAYVRAGKRAEGIRLATDAQRLAREFGQDELAAAIAAQLATLK